MNQSQALPTTYSRLYELSLRALLLWDRPLYAALVTALFFLGISSLIGVPWRPSGASYFNYLADAFLHGQLHLRLIPSSTLDLSLFNGKYYLYWGPLPAVIAMPLVALFGAQVSDVLQSITFGALNVGIFSLLLHVLSTKGYIQLTPVKRALLVLFFSLGTMQAPILAVGKAWYLGQVESVTFALLAFLAAFSLSGWKSFFWTSAAMAGVLTTRSSAVFIAVFLVWYLLRSHWHLGIRTLIRFCLIGLLPALAAMALLLVYNLLRFGGALDNGLDYHLMSTQFVEMARQYGIFNLHYIPINLYYDYVYYPLATLGNKVVVPIGGSLFLLSPLFFAALYALWQERRDLNTWFLFAAVVLGNIPALMVMAPGSLHFGPRYLLDVAVPLLVLTAIGIQRWSNRWILILVGISVIHYVFGSIGMVFLAR